jgi:pimeloyl-ACP methyl ester carboxylesterase
MEKKCITSANGTVWYWLHRHSSPDAPWIVFTHGLSANHTMFDRQAGHFAQSYSFITWDVPLHGESTPYKHFSFANAAKELNTILETEHIAQTVLVGMSMGGYVCQQFIDTYPEKAQAFIAIDTTPFGLRYYSRTDLFWLCHAGMMTAYFPEKMMRRNFAKTNAASEEGRRLMLQMLAPLSKREICHQMSMAGSALFTENRDINLTCPVLIIVGKKDQTSKVQHYCKAWAQETGYPLVWIPDAAHLSNVDNWQAVNSAIDDFIKPLLETSETAATENKKLPEKAAGFSLRHLVHSLRMKANL